MNYSELFYIIEDITNMENEGRRFKAMYILLDVAQRMKKNEITASMNQAEVFADYGIVLKDGEITDWGNTDVNTWKNKWISAIPKDVRTLNADATRLLEADGISIL